ncbi:transglutaminase-like domain-containing protein [Nitrospina watsonii]|uniref:transglutaminase-like domain-containing protein n=1 Tax=Nitrospina watsonii TaxID=1323948 RepID=UPI00248F9224|nr:transglutaminase-like domain-containing protein [Nitrospina watsonii]
MIAVWVVAVLMAGLAESAPIVERDDWSGTYFNGQKMGFNRAVVTVRPDEIRVHTQMFFRLEAGGAEQVTSISQDTRLTPDLKLKTFSLLQEIMGSRQRIEAHVEGSQLLYKITTSGYSKEKSMDLPADAIPASTAWLNLIHAGLEVGRKGTMTLLIEPFQMTSLLVYEVLRQETIDHRGKPVETFVVKQEYAGIKTYTWATVDGTVLRERTLQGFESVHEPASVARELPPEVMSVSNFITLSLVKTDKPIAAARTLKELKLSLRNLTGPDAIPNDHRQQVLDAAKEEGGDYQATLLIRQEPAHPAQKVGFPLDGEATRPYLEDSSQIQSEHPMIRALAKELKGESADPWRVALDINKWVYSNIEKVLVDAFTAVDALNTRRGECQSHTNLYTAIARAAGIPTRVVNGIVYSEDFNGFVYHAWPEVFVGEWRALDPTLGQEGVDATHIKLSEGNTQGSLKLMEFVGRLGIDVLEK